MSGAGRCGCGCTDATAAAVHAIAAALRAGDLDAALTLGLLDAESCPTCSETCRVLLLTRRDERRRALAARDRFHARNERLARHARERAQRSRGSSGEPADASTAKRASALPSAAAAALARARARAAERHKP